MGKKQKYPAKEIREAMRCVFVKNDIPQATAFKMTHETMNILKGVFGKK